MLSHRLHDTFAVDLLEKGVPLEEVSKLLGHESIKTTEGHCSKWMKGLATWRSKTSVEKQVLSVTKRLAIQRVDV
jgi:site-specific recombinase XerD